MRTLFPLLLLLLLTACPMDDEPPPEPPKEAPAEPVIATTLEEAAIASFQGMKVQITGTVVARPDAAGTDQPVLLTDDGQLYPLRVSGPGQGNVLAAKGGRVAAKGRLVLPTSAELELGAAPDESAPLSLIVFHLGEDKDKPSRHRPDLRERGVRDEVIARASMELKGTVELSEAGVFILLADGRRLPLRGEVPSAGAAKLRGRLALDEAGAWAFTLVEAKAP